MDTAVPSGVPAFITMLTAYRRKVNVREACGVRNL